MPSSTAQSARPAALTGYSPVHPRLIDAMDRVAVDLFRGSDGGQPPALFCSAGCKPAPGLAGQQPTGRQRPLYVRSGDLQRLVQELIGRLDMVMADELLPTADRFLLLHTALATRANQTFSLGAPDKFIALAEQTAGCIVTMLMAGAPVPEDLFRAAKHSNSAFTHGANVACYAVLLAMTLGVRDERELRAIAVGGMLHDLGKRRLPTELVHKAAGFSADECLLLESHPQHGYEDLVTRERIGRDELMIVYQHHERLDGSGYPVGVTGEEIHRWARLVAVVNVFDARTRTRTHHDATPPRVALERLQMHAGSHYDREMVQCWTTIMKKI